MFEKLVVSTARRRSRRTAKFFVCTSIIYLSAVAFAVALSILLATPKLADTASAGPTLSMIPIGGLREKQHDTRKSSEEPPKDPRNVQPLDRIVENLGNSRQAVIRPALPPGTGIAGGLDAHDGGSVIPGILSLTGREGSGTEVAEPPTPDPPKPTPHPTQTDNKPLRLTSSVLQGKVIDRRVPIYPELPRRIRLQGDVAVEVIISPEGRVESARALSGHPMFIASALDAARAWRFEPTLLNGVPVRVTGVITFVFKFNE